ncbi:unnamed protein product [Nippostrongylus brasiliensis]|uniref:Ricin B-type lectin domain-containing protein n=1 Tax=Nippostrongylus brasiliensis TaxID=27835 RepID=A0A158R2H5_NIPBR|nr:unnamed protein product [Nippostrongylus brasiliensis]
MGRKPFESFEVVMARESVFSRRFDLSVDVMRNLDSSPDLCVVASISKLTWRVTSDFYILLRGVLEKNFGDPLIPIPETIPIEILQRPTAGCEVGSDNKYATLSFRLLFNDVELDCQVPQMQFESPSTTLFGKAFTPFAKMQLDSARVSFDVFIDGQSELDLVCDSANLIDTREKQPGSGSKNLFSTILRPRELSNKRYQLMSEAHIMMRKDEVPVVTLVLMHSRVLLLYDWLNDAKNFVLLSTDFVPKYQDDMVRGFVNGIVARTGNTVVEPQQTISLKITLRDSDLYLLENPAMKNSFAVVVNTSAVLNVNDSGGVMTTNLEIQNMNIGWCCMQNEESTLNQCSNEFSIAVSMAEDASPLKDVKKRGLPSLAVKRHTVEVSGVDIVMSFSRQACLESFAIQIHITGMIGRLSCKDVSVLRCAAAGFLQNFKQNSSCSMIPVVGTPGAPKNVDIGRIILKSERIDVWLLDDYQGSSIPLLRMSLLTVEDIQLARTTQRKASVRWITVPKDVEHTFEFPPRLLLYSHSEREPPRQLIVRVSGWDEISPVNVDACGTYFRLVKGTKRGVPTARVVIQVSMEKDGKKVVAVRSSIDIKNQLPHELAVYSAESKQELMLVEPSQCKPIPLAFAHCQFLMCPLGCQVEEKAEVTWSTVRVAGETLNRTQCLHRSDREDKYWLCTAVRREHYPDQESLPGHSISVVAPLSVQNLLPIDIEIHIHGNVYPIAAGRQLLITSIDITRTLSIGVVTDRMKTVQECCITKSSIGEGQLHDANGRPLDMYGNVHIGTGGSISFSLWVPYWIVNKSGFYVQLLGLLLLHYNVSYRYYNIGVEVRAGTGRYKDTQVVLLTPRYLISNQSSYAISVCHHDLVDRASEHVHIASQCSLVWNENYEDCRQLCVRRSDVRHWSCPDADETPRFVRVEVILNSAVFCVTFTDAEYYPAPIRIDNQSDVPVLYQQQSEGPIGQHLRTICKARSHVDYAWDDLYGSRRIVLQVYENKSNVYDPSQPGIGPQLVYENNAYIQLTSSFNSYNISNSKKTDDHEQVLETMQKGKVMLNKQNRVDANNGNQLWVICKDGCIENVGMSNRSKIRMVLDVLERMGFQLMMTPRSTSRDRYQKWTLSPDGRLWCRGVTNMSVTYRAPDIVLAPNDSVDVDANADSNQVWRIQRQRPGSGTLEVECMHNGPTLIDNQLLSSDKWQVLYCQPEVLMPDDDPHGPWANEDLPPGVSTTSRPALKLEMNCTPMKHYDAFLPSEFDLDKIPCNCCSFKCFRVKLCDLDVQLDELLLWKLVQFAQASDAASSVQQKTLSLPPNTDLERTDPLRTRRWYFGTLDLEMGQIALSVMTVSKSSLPPECRALKQQFNMKLVSFENAAVYLPPFRQFHYFETSSFLLESLQKFYFAELQKQTLNIVVTLDAFGNPQGLVTDLKDSFQGALRGITTGAVDTVTKPVQGLFDLVEGTASAMKELAGPSTGSGRRLAATGRVRPPRLCRNLYHLLPPYCPKLADAQMEMMRINGYSTKERLLDVEICLEQFKGDGIIRQYVLISTRQCYVCQQVFFL